MLCLRVGNIAGGRSRFSVGYPPDVPESLERLTAELADGAGETDTLLLSLRGGGGAAG